MTTVATRSIRSSPQRDASETWRVIVDMLTRGVAGDARDQLLSVSGLAGMILADRAAKEAAIVVTSDGPRTRIYCLYDDDAIDGADANEDPLGFAPLNGDWRLSLPCEPDDLEWVQRALKDKSARITARDKSITFAVDEEAAAKSRGLVLNTKALLGK